MLKIALRSPPVDGEANTELQRFLAATLGVPKRSVTLTLGRASRRKRVLIEGATIAMVSEGLG